MIDPKQLRDDPERFREGARAKNVDVDIDRLLELDTEKRRLQSRHEEARAEQKRLGKETGPQIGKLKGALKNAPEDQRDGVEAQIAELETRPLALKHEIHELDAEIAKIDPELTALLLTCPNPSLQHRMSPEEPALKRTLKSDNGILQISIRQKPFTEQRGFAPKTHIELVHELGLADFQRGVKMAGTRHYVCSPEKACACTRRSCATPSTS